MGKVKTRFLGVEEIEKKQKQEQKKKADKKSKIKLPGKHKGGERTVVVETDEASQEKLEKAKALVEQKQVEEKKKTIKQKKARVRGERYMQAKKLVEREKTYSLSEAFKLLKEMKTVGFDQSLELHANLTKEGMKGELELPHSTGKTVRVRIVDDKTLKEIENGKIEFDILVTHPSYMPRLAQLARILGPKGLMPNPKTGTISDKPEAVAGKFEKGLLRWKSEPKFPMIHLMVGKLSHPEKALIENTEAFLRSVGKENIKSAFIKSTMSPSIRLNLEKI